VLLAAKWTTGIRAGRSATIGLTSNSETIGRLWLLLADEPSGAGAGDSIGSLGSVPALNLVIIQTQGGRAGPCVHTLGLLGPPSVEETMMMRRAIAGLITGSLVLVGLAACQKVQKPTSDSAVPTLVWHVENQTQNTTTDITGTGSVSGAKGDDFRVTLTASEAGGIHEIDLDGGYVRSCSASGLGQAANGDYAPLQQILNPDSQGNVLTSIFLIDSYTPDVTCNSGFDWTGTTITLDGKAINYYSGTTNGTLTISIKP
jgi:hypothetical protein